MIEIPDRRFLKCLKDLGYAEVGIDNKIKLIKPKRVYKIELSDQNIRSLKGIEYFINLKTLDIRYNKLDSINLSENKYLEIVKAKGNKLRLFDGSNLSNLKYLCLRENKISSILLPTSNQLFYLNLNKNKLANIDISCCPKIRVLDCSANNLADLNISKNNLIYLNYSKNKISNLNVANQKILEVVINNDSPLEREDFIDVWESFLEKKLELEIMPVEGNEWLWLLDVFLKLYDEKKIFHRYERGTIIISTEIISYTGIIDTLGYLSLDSDLYIDFSDKKQMFYTEASLLNIPAGEYPYVIEFKFKENEIQFYFEEAGFTSCKGCVGDAQYFQYVENTNGEARQPRKLFVVND
jgi:hypothetical protein